ncbi:hypothetical protein EPN16_01865 [bacterium]|nr:MAG: hypothetical protein EPN16_01865 [bacterium]
MKKCLHTLLALGIAGFYCARSSGPVFCAPDTARRIQQIEKTILLEGKALKGLQGRYENILKRQWRLRSFLEQKKRRDRKRVIESTLARIKRWEAKEKSMRELLEK